MPTIIDVDIPESPDWIKAWPQEVAAAWESSLAFRCAAATADAQWQEILAYDALRVAGARLAEKCLEEIVF